MFLIQLLNYPPPLLLTLSQSWILQTVHHLMQKVCWCCCYCINIIKKLNHSWVLLPL